MSKPLRVRLKESVSLLFAGLPFVSITIFFEGIERVVEDRGCLFPAIFDLASASADFGSCQSHLASTSSVTPGSTNQGTLPALKSLPQASFFRSRASFADYGRCWRLPGDVLPHQVSLQLSQTPTKDFDLFSLQSFLSLPDLSILLHLLQTMSVVEGHLATSRHLKCLQLSHFPTRNFNSFLLRGSKSLRDFSLLSYLFRRTMGVVEGHLATIRHLEAQLQDVRLRQGARVNPTAASRTFSKPISYATDSPGSLATPPNANQIGVDSPMLGETSECENKVLALKL